MPLLAELVIFYATVAYKDLAPTEPGYGIPSVRASRRALSARCDSFILVLVFCNDFNVGLEGIRALDSYGRQYREVSSLASRGTS